MIKYDHQEKAISLHHFRHLWQIYWVLFATLIMTIRNLHLAPGRWELKELKVFSNIFGELWTCIEACAWLHLTPFQLTCKSEFTAEWCANWKSSVLKPAAHSILTPLVSLSPSRHPEAKVDKSHVCSLLKVWFKDIAALWFLGFRHIARLEQEFLLM